MSPSPRKKARFSYTQLWNAITLKKTLLPTSDVHSNSETDSGAREAQTPVDKVDNEQRGNKKRPLAALRRSSSKIFTALKIHESGRNRVLSPLSNGSIHELSQGIATLFTLARHNDDSNEPAKSSIEGLCSSNALTNQSRSTQSAPPLNVPEILENCYSPLSKATNKSDGGTTITRLVDSKSNDAIFRRRGPRGLQERRSMQNLAQLLSHRGMRPVDGATVIHRPGRRCRLPLPLAPLCKSEASRKPPIALSDGSTDLSNLYDGRSISSHGISTGKTSVESTQLLGKSNSKTLISDKSKPGLTIVDNRANEHMALFSIHEYRFLSKPKVTIKTVELTASAKIFFETHFNSLLSTKETPRTLRQKDLDRKLHSEFFTAEQRLLEQEKWAKQETHYLRQARLSKSRHNRKGQGSGVSIAGYRVLRVLGKGSFGVVRLVCETSKNALSEKSGLRTRRAENSSGSSTFSAFMRSVDERGTFCFRGDSKRSKQVYAMKVIRKSEMLRNSQEGHLRAERDFLVASESSRWIVPLVESFQDNVNLYLVMEFMIGGDFLGMLIKYDKIEEKRARWYLAEMILCLEETHRLGWIHRDVKPDNFLISSSGHLKISDFGLAFDGHWAHNQNYFNNHRHSLLAKLGIDLPGDEKDQIAAAKPGVYEPKTGNTAFGQIQTEPCHKCKIVPSGFDPFLGDLHWHKSSGSRELAKSIVGTSQYMAPEVIRGEAYDGRCDWWSIGIILYEVCLYGETPFIGKDRQSTKRNVLACKGKISFVPNRRLQWHHRVSRDAKDLISRLLQEKRQRLGSRQYLQNDHDMGCTTIGERVSSSEDLASSAFQPKFVFPDDAVDIKSHPFFQYIDWNNHHLTKPPEVPKVKDCFDTTYFDQEAPVSDVDDNSTESSIVREVDLQNQENYERGIAEAFEREFREGQLPSKIGHAHVLGDMIKIKSVRSNGLDASAPKENAGGIGFGRPIKRPRDLILRDKAVAKQALECRKKGAFLGYTYRRPKVLEVTVAGPGIDPLQKGEAAPLRGLIPTFQRED